MFWHLINWMIYLYPCTPCPCCLYINIYFFISFLLYLFLYVTWQIISFSFIFIFYVLMSSPLDTINIHVSCTTLYLDLIILCLASPKELNKSHWSRFIFYININIIVFTYCLMTLQIISCSSLNVVSYIFFLSFSTIFTEYLTKLKVEALTWSPIGPKTTSIHNV